MNAQLAFGAPRLLSPVRATAIFVAVSATVGSLQAQTLQPAMARHSGDTTIAAAPASEADTSEVALLVGRSTLLSVGFANSDDGWIVGRGGIALRSGDGGLTWVRQEVPTTQNLYALSVGKKRCWAVGGDGIVLQYER